MNPSSLDRDFSTVQRQKEMYKYAGSELFHDEGLAELHRKYFILRGNQSLEVKTIFKLFYIK